MNAVIVHCCFATSALPVYPDVKKVLKEQDYPQASEKLWGATAQVIKAIALKRGKHLRSHATINNLPTSFQKNLMTI